MRLVGVWLVSSMWLGCCWGGRHPCCVLGGFVNPLRVPSPVVCCYGVAYPGEMRKRSNAVISSEAIEEYRAADAALRHAREQWRTTEDALMATRDAWLRRMVGPDRGGIARTASLLNVSVAQVLRLLDDGIARATHGALSRAGIPRERYQLTHQRGGKRIGVVPIVMDGAPTYQSIIVAMEDEGLTLLDRRPMRFPSDLALWKALKETKKTAWRALTQAGISAGTFRLSAERGDTAVRLTIVAKLTPEIVQAMSEQFAQVLRDAGLTVSPGEDHQLNIVPLTDGEQSGTELVFGWRMS